MANVADTFIRDGNSEPITALGLVTAKTVAFDGAAGNGATGTVALFTVTGDVVVRVFGVCSETLVSAGGGSIAVGTANNTAVLLSALTATAIVNNDIVAFGQSPTEISSWSGTGTASQPFIVGNGADILATIATANITDGTIKFYCLWVPLTSGASVVAA